MRILLLLAAAASLAACSGMGPGEASGRIIGAGAGAALGHQVGRGDGRTAATIVGALIGANVGGEVGRAQDPPGVVGFRPRPLREVVVPDDYDRYQPPRP